MHKIARSLLALVLAGAVSGCLGTVVTAPGSQGRTYGSTRVHIIAAPVSIDARDCKTGIREITNFVPLWGVAVGILTFGILVPMTTTFTCAK